MHSRDYVCDEIGDLLVALTKCPNAPILIVDEIPGAIHVLIHAAISVPEVVPAHLDPLQALADRPDPVRAVPLALVMTTVVVIHAEILVVAIVIVHPVVILAIDPVATGTEHHVVILVTVPVVIVDPVVNSVIDPLVILVVAIVIAPLAVMALMPVVMIPAEIVPVVIVVRVANTAIARLEIVLPVASTEIARSAVTIHVVIAPVVIEHRAVILVEIVQPEIVVQAPIVVRVVNMVIVRFVVMILVAIRVVAIVIVHLVESLAIVIVHLVVNSVIVRPAVTIQVLTHVAATEIVRRVVMVQALVAHLVRVVMTAVMAVVAVGLVAKISHHADQRTKLNVVAKPCARAAEAKCAKTANKLRCHAKPRPGLTKAESKTTCAMLPKAPCAVRSHRDALCRRDQKMKTN